MSDNKEIMIPNEIPEYAMTTQDAAAMYEDAMTGISTGMPPAIRAKGGKFRLIEGGEETTIKKLVDGQYLPVVILAAKRALNKTYYATAYDPNVEADAPDCWSIDGVKPDGSIKNPVSKTCATCPMNAYGSGRNNAGQPTKGKACQDTKILAVSYAGGVYSLRIPPASLKNFGTFVRALQTRKVQLGAVITFLSLDDEADFPVLNFRVGGFVPREKVAALAELAGSPEVDEIVHPTYAVEPAPEQTSPAAQAPDVEAEDKAKAEAAAKAEADKKAKAEADKKAKAAAEKKAKAEAAAEKKAKAEASTPDPDADEDGEAPPSDDELADLLGL
jgi:hypothetical protein